jgi:uncharacterized membrane protein
MINGIIFEAKLVGFKEGLKIGLVWLVFYSYLLSNKKKELIKPFYAALALSFFLAFSSLFFSDNLISKEIIGKIISFSFAIFLIISGAALYHSSGVNLIGKGDFLNKIPVSSSIVFLLTLFFFLPDSTGSLIFLKELAFIKENEVMTYLSAFLGLLIASVIFFTLIKLYRPYGLGSFFDLPQLLLFLAMVKLFGSGISGISELSLIPSVQRGFMKFIHDLVHQTFVMLMVPDHPLLKMTTWNFIGFFFGSGFASIISLFLLLTLPAIFIYHTLFKPLPEPHGGTKISRRKIKSLMLSDRRRKALPVILFSVFILLTWFSHGEETVSKIYTPEPRPVVMDRGFIIIPLKDPAMDLMDGRLYKFSLRYEGEEIRIIVIRKSDNALSVCLDACEICPPAGYGQRDDHVVCIYCNTPIAVDSLGEPGGCNPIPLAAEIDDRYIRIEMKEILKKWGFLKLGK